MHSYLNKLLVWLETPVLAVSSFTADEWCIPHRRHSAIAQRTDGI
ncbi:MAG: hypothetical protein ACRC8Y_04445 [Chroococcales cyanobacterium]